MSKSITDKEYEETAKLIDKVAEPLISKLLTELNAFLNNKGIKVGAEVTWFFDKIEQEDKK